MKSVSFSAANCLLSEEQRGVIQTTLLTCLFWVGIQYEVGLVCLTSQTFSL